jgi:putative chitinase
MAAVITPALLQAATECTAAASHAWAEHFAHACEADKINTPLRLAHFFAQLGHESMGLYYVREVWGPTAAQIRYERDFAQPWPANRAESKLARFYRNALAWSLGNTEKGDGKRFMGRGFIQTTGRANAAKLRARLRGRSTGEAVPDFEKEPAQLEKAPWAVLSATDYWAMRGINALADTDDIEAVTRAINGGTNGLVDRRARLTRAKRALEIT